MLVKHFWNFKRKGTTEAEETPGMVEIRIKTLQEIRQEKAARSAGQGPAHENGTRGTIVQLKRKRKLARGEEEELRGRSEAPRQWEVPAKKATVQPSKIVVKTLEEILQEKAARTQAKAQVLKAVEVSAPAPAPLKRRILRINRNTATGADSGGQTTSGTSEADIYRSRHSTATPDSSSSAPLDEFDELINEFTGNALDWEMELDPLMDLDDCIVELMATINSS